MDKYYESKKKPEPPAKKTIDENIDDLQQTREKIQDLCEREKDPHQFHKCIVKMTKATEQQMFGTWLAERHAEDADSSDDVEGFGNKNEYSIAEDNWERESGDEFWNEKVQDLKWSIAAD